MGEDCIPLTKGVRVDAATIWSSLPNEMIERVFLWLPLQSVFRFRSVCRKWKDMLSCNEFLISWAGMPIRHPWLVLATQYPCHVHRFCFWTWTWKPIPLLAERYSYSASCRGLLFVEEMPKKPDFSLLVYNPLNQTTISRLPDFTRNSTHAAMAVWNPQRQTYSQIPWLLRRNIRKARIHMLGSIVGEEYKVVTVGPGYWTLTDKFVVRVYNSTRGAVASKDLWTVTIHPLQNLTFLYDNMVFCKNFFFCKIGNPELGIIIFRVKEDCTSEIVHPFVALPPNGGSAASLQLIASPSSVLLIAEVQEEIVLWELEFFPNPNSNPFWKPISRMPQIMLENSHLAMKNLMHSNPFSNEFECVVVEN